MKVRKGANSTKATPAISLDEVERDLILLTSLDSEARRVIITSCRRIEAALMTPRPIAPRSESGAPRDDESLAEPDRLLEVEEAAQILGVCTATVYRNGDRYPFARRIGRRFRFSANGIKKFMIGAEKQRLAPGHFPRGNWRGRTSD
jgi:predicted DNA-binding transcriptional regulator AlpA